MGNQIIGFFFGSVSVVLLILLSTPFQNFVVSILDPVTGSGPLLVAISDLLLFLTLYLVASLVWQKIFQLRGLFPDKVFTRRNFRFPLVCSFSVLPIWLLYEQNSDSFIDPYVFYLGSYFVFDWVSVWLSGRELKAMFPFSIILKDVYKKADEFWQVEEFSQAFDLLVPRAFHGDVEAQKLLAFYLGESRWEGKYSAYEAMFAAQASNHDRLMAHYLATCTQDFVSEDGATEWDLKLSLLIVSESASDGYISSTIGLARLMTTFGSEATQKSGLELFEMLIGTPELLSPSNGCAEDSLSTVHHNLGICYQEGLGCKKNQDLADEHFTTAQALAGKTGKD